MPAYERFNRRIIAVAVVGLSVAFFASTRWREHVGRLLEHFRSGSWEVQTDSDSFESAIRVKYGAQRGKWDIRYLAGSGDRFPLDFVHREASLQSLGRATMTAGRGFAPRSELLPSAYGALLAESVVQLGTLRKPVERRALASFAEVIGLAPSLGLAPAPDYAALRRAHLILAELPGSHALRKALDNYALWKDGHGLDFPGFAVASIPAALDKATWSRAAVTFPQVSRCNGTVRPYGSGTEALPATIAVFPRAVDVALHRPWLSDDFLDEAAADPAYQRFFAVDGALRSIPSRLWIRMEDLVRVEFGSADRFEEVRGWVRAGRCCVVRCESTEIPLDAETSLVTTDDAIQGLASGQEPLLFAVISRQRMARGVTLASRIAGENR